MHHLFFLAFIVFCILPTPYAQAQQKQLNPDISLNGLLHYQVGSKGNQPTSEFKNGWSLKEAELRMTSNLDAYFRGDVTLALEKVESTLHGGEDEYHIEPEEIFVETLQVPAVTFRVGKYYLPFGKHNELHTHAYYFIDAPLSQSALFHEHGLSETGLGAYYLLPTNWFMEFSAHVNEASNEHVFGTGTNDDVMGLYHLKNLWDLNDASTFEWTLSYGHGRDQGYKFNHIYNTSMTYKWRPVENSKETSLSWTLDASAAQNTYDDAGAKTGPLTAISTWVMYQFDQSWWAQFRHGQQDTKTNNLDAIQKNSVLIGYVPTEYSAIRLQYDVIDDPSQTKNEQRGTLQFNFSMGAHPAHAY